VLVLDLDVEEFLVIIAFLPRLLEHLDLVVKQPSAYGGLQLRPADLLPRLLLLGSFNLGLEPRLHADAQRRIECHLRRVPADLGLRVCLTRGRFPDGNVRFPQRLHLKRSWPVGGNGEDERLERGDGL